MYFLVDFENVHSEGLRGVEFLKKSDSLTLFFSKRHMFVKVVILRRLSIPAALLIHVSWQEQEKMAWIFILRHV